MKKLSKEERKENLKKDLKKIIKYAKEKSEKAVEGGAKSLGKGFTSTKRIKGRKVLKNDTVVTIKKYKAENIWEDENRFFKGELNKEKRSMFFD